MKPLILSATAATLALSSMTAAAWWGQPYAAPYYGPYAYGAPYVIAPPTPQQLRQMAEQRREAAIAMMDAQREAMAAARSARGLPVPETPDVLSGWDLPEPPAFGERPAIPEMPAFGERPALPELPPLPELSRPELPSIPLPSIKLPDMPALPEPPTIPSYDEPLAMPELPYNREQRAAEIDTHRAALKQQATERRAAMEAIAEQRRAIAEQRRQDWLCARQRLQPMPYAASARDCAPASEPSDADARVESSDQAADSVSASNKAS